MTEKAKVIDVRDLGQQFGPTTETVGSDILNGFDGGQVVLSGDISVRLTDFGDRQMASDNMAVILSKADRDTVGEAIGYLSTWALNGYPFCFVFIGGNGEMEAVYRKARDGSPYVIGAIPHFGDDGRIERYSFHS